MKTKKLGKSDLTVSQLCLGTMHFGSKEDEQISFRLLDRFVEAGGNFLDTANIYARWISGCSGGESESLLGRWMKDRGNRSTVVVATKVGFEYPGVDRGLTARQIKSECEKSLTRLGTDHIDLYYSHCDDRTTPVDETLEAYHRLVADGKVRYIGASNFTAWRIQKSLDTSAANDFPPYVCVQQRYTYLRPRSGTTFSPQLAVNDDLIDFCRSEDFPLCPYSPLLGGAYERSDKSVGAQYLGADTDTRLATLNAVASEIGVGANQVVVAWMLHHDFPVFPLVAASTIEQLNDNLAAADLQLTGDQMRRLTEAGA